MVLKLGQSEEIKNQSYGETDKGIHQKKKPESKVVEDILEISFS